MANNTEFYKSTAALIGQGKTIKAIENLHAFLDSTPLDPTALSLLGSAHLKNGNNEEAVSCFTDGVKAHPKSYSAHADLAFALMKTGDIENAVDAFIQAVDINPGFYQGWCFLEKLYFEAKKYSDALHAAEQSEKFDPFDNTYKDLQAAMRAGNKGKAERIARDILKRQPGHPRAAFVLAHLAGTVGAHEQTVDILKHGLEHHPANIHLRRALVQALEELGAYVHAIEEAEVLTKVQPDYRNWLILSRVQGHIGRHDLSLEAAEKSAACLETEDTELGKVDLLRGHALKILGRREESEDAYQACLKNTPGNGAGWWGLADLKNYQFSKDEIAQMRSLVESSEDAAQGCQAAFALGKAFENGVDVTTAFQWYKRANDMRPDINFDAEKHKVFVQALVSNFDKELLDARATPTPTGPTPIFILGLPRSGSTLIEQILASHSKVEGTMELTTLPNLERRISIQGGRQFKEKYPHSLKKFTAKELAQFGQAYLDGTAIYRTDKPYFIDKLPPNFERVGLIHKILPQAIIIDARRHPLDCGYSNYRQHFAAGHEWSYKLKDIGAYYNGYLDIMDHWDRVLPGKVICVQYEDMVRDTDTTIRNLISRVGLDFEDNCLRFFENNRAVRTASSEQVRQPIYTKSMGQWKPLEEQLSPLIESLGDETMERFEMLVIK